MSNLFEKTTTKFDDVRGSEESKKWKADHERKTKLKERRRSKITTQKQLYEQKREQRKEREEQEFVRAQRTTPEPNNSFRRGEKEDFERLVTAAEQIGLTVCLGEPWKEATECAERQLFDVEGNIVFQMYKMKKKTLPRRGLNLGIVMGSDTTIKVLEVHSNPNMILFSVTEPQRKVECNFTDNQLKFFELPVSILGKQITFSTTTTNYIAFPIDQSPYHDLYVWRTKCSSLVRFINKRCDRISKHDARMVNGNILTSDWPFNPITIENGYANLIWWRQPDNTQYKRHLSSIPMTASSNETCGEIYPFAKRPNLTFSVFPDYCYQYYTPTKGYLPKFERVAFVRGTIDHFTFHDWREMIHFQLLLPGSFRDSSLCWNSGKPFDSDEDDDDYYY